MSSLKTFDIRLTDIWIECQKELIEMRDKIIDLKTCLRTSEKINKHLIKCNEVLVAIIDNIKANQNHKNKAMKDLINKIKCEEECIEVEKQNMKKVREQIHCDFNEDKVIQLIADWNHSKPLKTSKQNKSIEKSTQTQKNDISIDSKSVNIKREVTIDLNQIDSKLESNLKSEIQTNSENKDSKTLEENIDFDENDNRSDASVKSDDFDINDNESDSDFEEKTPKNRKKKKCISKTNLRTIKINSMVMPYSVGDQYVCTRDECQFVCKVKRQFYRHLRSDHNIDCEVDEQIIRDYEKQVMERKNGGIGENSVRINKAVLPYKVGDEYICTKGDDCQFKCRARRLFYTHLRGHEPLRMRPPTEEKQITELKCPKAIRIYKAVFPYKIGEDYVCTKVDDCLFTCKGRQLFYKHLRGHDPQLPPQNRHPREVRSNNSERPFVCDWPTCSMAFRLPVYLRVHRKRHLGQRDYVCDWPGCGVRMYTAHNYKTHRWTHTDERPYKCEWPGCTYSAKQKWALVAHKRTHTGEKPYLCPFPECGYRCTQPCALSAHKRKHTGEKPYSCEVKGCDKRFSSLAGLWSHKRMHAKNETIQFSINANKSRSSKRAQIEN